MCGKGLFRADEKETCPKTEQGGAVMQREIREPQELLDENGRLSARGWSRGPLLYYDRDRVAASKWRLKEWDYYLVANDDCAVALTVADNGYMGLVSASVLDFRRPWEHTQSVMKAFPMGRFAMPATTRHGDVSYSSKRVGMKFSKAGSRRYLKCEFLNFYEGKHLYVNLRLEEPEQDSMVIATPFPKSGKAFYYNQKINCMRASGVVRMGGEEYVFDPAVSFGTLDWGRGVWTYKNTWYWGSANCTVDGAPFGFNLGYGFGDTSAATENIAFYGGVGHKLDQVTFHIPKKDILKPWVISSNDGRFEMEFVPIIDRAAKLSAGIVSSDQHQVFGCFSGQVLLDDGTPIRIRRATGFAEKVINRW